MSCSLVSGHDLELQMQSLKKKEIPRKKRKKELGQRF